MQSRLTLSVAVVALLGAGCNLLFGIEEGVLVERDGGAPSTALRDAGATRDAEPPTDAGTGDGEIARKKESGKFILVHASHELPAVRFCFGTGVTETDVAVLPEVPIPNRPHGTLTYPGLPPGTGAVAPEIPDISYAVITPFVILAETIKGETADGGPDGGQDAGPDSAKEDDCVALLGKDGSGGILKAGSYYRLPPISSPLVLPDTTTLIALTGCRPYPDYLGTEYTCGADYNLHDGSLRAQAFRLDRSIADPTRIGVQVVHASPAWDEETKSLNGLATVSQLVSIFSPTGSTQVATIATPPGVTLGKAAPDVSVSLSTSVLDPANLVVVSTRSGIRGDGGIVNRVTMSLALVTHLTNGMGTATDANPFVAGQNYAFVLVGDPRYGVLQDGGMDLTAAHILAFPTNPPFPLPSEF